MCGTAGRSDCGEGQKERLYLSTSSSSNSRVCQTAQRDLLPYPWPYPFECKQLFQVLNLRVLSRGAGGGGGS